MEYMMEAWAWANGLNLQTTLAGLDGPTRRNKEGWSNPVSNEYTTSDDRYIMLGVQNASRDWPKLANLLDHPEWLDEERMAEGKVLLKNRFYVKDKMDQAFRALPAKIVCERLAASGIVYRGLKFCGICQAQEPTLKDIRVKLD